MKKLILLLLIVPLEMFSQYFQDVDVYDNYGNHLGTFEVDSDYYHDYSQLQGAIEDAAGMAVDKYINYLKQKERKEQEIRARQSLVERGARVGITIPSYVTSTAAFESMIIQKEQAAYKRKIRAINQARTAKKRASQSNNSNYSGGGSGNYTPPRKDFSLLNSGLKKFEDEDYKAAIQDFSAYIQKYPDDPDGWFGRGNAKTWEDDWGGACYDWKRSADLGKQKAQEQLLKYCNIDGTLKKTSSASGAGKVDETTKNEIVAYVDKEISPLIDFNSYDQEVTPELRELWNKYMREIVNQYIEYKNLSDTYIADAPNQYEDVNKQRMDELQEMQEKFREFTARVINTLNEKYSKIKK